jgi:dolichol kinase
VTGTALRRAIHAASGAVLLLIYVAPPVVYRSLIVGATVAALGVDLVRIGKPAVHEVLFRALPVFRPSERYRLSGASWLMLGYTAAVLLPSRAAAAGILVGALADPAAAMVGERLGGSRAKSWSGTLAALVTGCAALAASGFPIHVVVVASAVGAAAERWSGPVDDNLVVAPVVGATVVLLA